MPNLGPASNLLEFQLMSDGNVVVSTMMSYLGSNSVESLLISLFPRSASQCGGTVITAILQTEEDPNLSDIKLVFPFGEVTMLEILVHSLHSVMNA